MLTFSLSFLMTSQFQKDDVGNSLFSLVFDPTSKRRGNQAGALLLQFIL